MGRAMIIICAGALVALGFVSIGTSEQGKRLTEKNVGYAEFVAAKNAAHTAVQIAMDNINKDENWSKNHGEDNKWKANIEGYADSVSLYVEHINDPDANGFWETDTIRIVSEAKFRLDSDPYKSSKKAKVVSVYLKNYFDAVVPDFISALTIATKNFSFTASGSASIHGTDKTGSCSDQPAVTVMDDKLNPGKFKDLVNTNISTIDTQGDVSADESLSYQPTDKLIARLEDMPETQTVSGTYKGDLGTADNPGVFFVEDAATLTGGIEEGFGIMVIRSAGSLSLVDSTMAELDVAGNFTFNGLVIFENAYNFDGKGTPTINGSVLVGNTEDHNEKIDIDINGNLHLQSDCTAEEYAKKAAALTIDQNRYRRISTFE